MSLRGLKVFVFASSLLLGTREVYAADAFGESQSQLPRAEDALKNSKGDGVYARFTAPWALRVAPLYEYQLQGKIHRVGFEGSLSYLQSVGGYLRSRLAVGEQNLNYSPLFSGGLELQPLFLIRWSNGKERGPAFRDLLLDSIGLRGGVALQLHETSRQSATAAAEVALGFGVPLMGTAEGAWLRSNFTLLAGQRIRTLFGIQLEWQLFVGKR